MGIRLHNPPTTGTVCVTHVRSSKRVPGMRCYPGTECHQLLDFERSGFLSEGQWHGPSSDRSCDRVTASVWGERLTVEPALLSAPVRVTRRLPSRDYPESLSRATHIPDPPAQTHTRANPCPSATWEQGNCENHLIDSHPSILTQLGKRSHTRDSLQAEARKTYKSIFGAYVYRGDRN